MSNHLSIGLIVLASACSLSGLDDLSSGSRERDPDRDAAVEETERDTSTRKPDATREDAGDVDEPKDGKAEDERDSGSATDERDASPGQGDAKADPEPDAGGNTEPDSSVPPNVSPTGGLIADRGPCTGRGPGVLCDDFDTGELNTNQTNLRSGWSWEEEGDPYRPDALDLVDDGADHAGARSLKSSIGNGLNESDGGRLVYVFPSAPSRVIVEFDFKPTWPAAPLTNHVLRWIRLQQRATVGGVVDYPGIGLDARPDGILLTWDRFTAAGGFAQDGENAAPRFEGWKHVKLEVRFGTNAYARVSLDGEMVYEKSSFTLASEGVSESYVMFGLFSHGENPTSALYDNVQIEFTP